MGLKTARRPDNDGRSPIQSFDLTGNRLAFMNRCCVNMLDRIQGLKERRYRVASLPLGTTIST